MEIIKIDPNNPDQKLIDHAVQVLKHGGILVYPTDTSYGIGVDVTNPIAVKRLFKLKKRDLNKPVAVIVPSIEYVKNNLAKLTLKQEEIIRNYLPGAITFFVDPINKDKFIYAKFGFRIPAYHLTQVLANKFRELYATTSANISNLPPCFNIPDFLEQLKQSDCQPDMILDAGQLPKKLQSTIVDLTEVPPKILRHGAVEFKI